MKTRHSFLLLLGVLFFSTSHAQIPGYGYTSPYAQYPQYQQLSPAQLLELGVQVLQNYIKSGEFEDPDKVLQFLDSQMSDFFDFEQMAKWAARVSLPSDELGSTIYLSIQSEKAVLYCIC